MTCMQWSCQPQHGRVKLDESAVSTPLTPWFRTRYTMVNGHCTDKKAQLSLANPRDAKAHQNCSNSTCLQRCRWQYWSIFIRLVVVASEIREIPRNSLKIQTYRVQSHSRSFIDLGANRKLTCDFLLVTNSNFGPMCHRFWDIDA